MADNFCPHFTDTDTERLNDLSQVTKWVRVPDFLSELDLLTHAFAITFIYVCNFNIYVCKIEMKVIIASCELFYKHQRQMLLKHFIELFCINERKTISMDDFSDY